MTYRQVLGHMRRYYTDDVINQRQAGDQTLLLPTEVSRRCKAGHRGSCRALGFTKGSLCVS